MLSQFRFKDFGLVLPLVLLLLLPWFGTQSISDEAEAECEGEAPSGESGRVGSSLSESEGVSSTDVDAAGESLGKEECREWNGFTKPGGGVLPLSPWEREGLEPLLKVGAHSVRPNSVLE